MRNSEQITKLRLPVYMYCTSDDNSAWLFTSDEKHELYNVAHRFHNQYCTTHSL